MKKNRIILLGCALATAIPPIVAVATITSCSVQHKRLPDPTQLSHLMKMDLDEDVTFKLTVYSSVRDLPDLWYSQDGAISWTQILPNKDIVFSKNSPVYLAGNNPQGLVTSSRSVVLGFDCVSQTPCVTLSGSIMSLIGDYDGTVDTIPCDHCFRMLFREGNMGAKIFKEVKPGFLPAKNLKPYCYRQLFFNAGFASLPENLLPATHLTNGCYYEMFSGCKNLKSVPKKLLPAIELAGECYCHMFSYSALSELPDLPALKMEDMCYAYMFEGCESLITVAENCLPATKLATGCYFSMFEKCYNLTKAPKLPATKLAPKCYGFMFGSTKLAQLPILPAKELCYFCYQAMFTNISTITAVPSTIFDSVEKLGPGCFNGLFIGCESLTTVPANLLTKFTVLEPYCYKEMFTDCKLLTSIDENFLPVKTLANQCYSNMFERSGLTKMPKLPATSLANECYTAMFSGCPLTDQTAIDLPATNLKMDCYSSMFSGCNQLKNDITINLPATDIPPGAYRNMFNSSNLTTVPACLNNIVTVGAGSMLGMFAYCSELTTTGESFKTGCPVSYLDPATGGTIYPSKCFEDMFKRCSKLATINKDMFPWAKTTNVPTLCMGSMFAECTALEYTANIETDCVEESGLDSMYAQSGIKAVAEGSFKVKRLEYGACSEMFKDCAYLKTVAQGMFDATKEFWSSVSCAAMFWGCDNLVQPPILPNIKVNSHTYNTMFSFCGSLDIVDHEISGKTVLFFTAPENVDTYPCVEMFANTKNYGEGKGTVYIPGEKYYYVKAS